MRGRIVDLKGGLVLRKCPSRYARRIDLVFLRGGSEHQIRARDAERIFDEPLDLGGRPAACSNHAGVLIEAEVVREAAALSSQPPDVGALALAAELLRKGRF